jgi:D-hydroxyproline dehydrogenase subunit alpha
VLVVERDAECRTSVPEIFVAGDAGGLGGAHVAIDQGTLAGLAIARDLGRVPPETESRHARLVRRARRTLAKAQRFQSALWTLFEAPMLVDQLASADTLICRCEDVNKATLSALATEQAMSLSAIKRATCAAMGRCQGRYCAPIIAEMVQRARGGAPTEADYPAPCPPFRPTPIQALAGLKAETASNPHRPGAASLESDLQRSERQADLP